MDIPRRITFNDSGSCFSQAKGILACGPKANPTIAKRLDAGGVLKSQKINAGSLPQPNLFHTPGLENLGQRW